MEPIRKSSPRSIARTAGVFYALMAVCGGLATYARRGIMVTGDAAATAANILAHQQRYVLAFGGDVLVVATYVVVVALFYRIFKPVNKSVALTAACFGMMGCAIQATTLTLQLAPLTVLGGASYLRVFGTGELAALAYMFLRIYSQGYGVALVFFGFFCLSTGWLIYKSGFLPRFLGVFMMLAGVSWLVFLSPVFAVKYFAYVVPGAVGELLLTLWLIVKSVARERRSAMPRALS